ncbi:MAG: AAA family ATPase [Bacilli bacterium]|nr:AAA family ATPase [Bacilli bacterium]
MKLKEIRINKNLTQEEASHILGVSLRTYKTYETNSDENNEKYRSMCLELLKHETGDYNLMVMTRNSLMEFINSVKNYKSRSILKNIQDYLSSPFSNKVLILYGIRRSGKTTLIKQALLSMSKTDFNKSAFIQPRKESDMSLLYKDLKRLQKEGFRYVFIDEITLLSDFIDNAALLADIFASSSMKIVLSGTDSLGFLFAKDDQLYNRNIFIHTTFIPYKEFESVLGIKGVDEYISYGGTMSIEGHNYQNQSLFSSNESINEYIDTSIAKNIQHSLKCYDNGDHFRSLRTLYEKGELTNAINRVIEDINHRFVLEVLNREFSSSDLSLARKNLRNDKKNPNDILDYVDANEINHKMKDALEMLSKEERKIDLDDVVVAEIKEYLSYLDIIKEIDVISLPSNSVTHKVLVTIPGLRYGQSKLLTSILLEDEVFNTLSFNEKKIITNRILDTAKGVLMEEMVLFESYYAKKNNVVCKVLFAIGEYDMVIQNNNEGLSNIYEIKHSQEVDDHQIVHLLDDEKNRLVEFKFGSIKSKNVIYRGETTTYKGINYINVEEYLKSL